MSGYGRAISDVTTLIDATKSQITLKAKKAGLRPATTAVCIATLEALSLEIADFTRGAREKSLEPRDG